MKVRVSFGTLVALGMERGTVMDGVGVAYVMQYSDTGCLGTCAFCSQSVTAVSARDTLARVVWPAVDLQEFLERLRVSRLSRVCLQTVIKKGFVEEAHELVKAFTSVGRRTSLSITPVPLDELITFREEGVDYVGVGLDAASPNVFSRVGKPFTWDTYWDFIRDSLMVFGRGRVVVHLIVGLGESLEEMLDTIQRVYRMGGDVSLFAFTPLKGTPMEGEERPSVRYYRVVQLSLNLIFKGYDWREFISYVNGSPCVKKEYLSALSRDELWGSFLTRGCPHCNRPFYNERPGRRLYNYPSLSFLKSSLRVVEEDLKSLSCP